MNERVISPEELPIWVPGEILSASDGLDWRGVGQRTFRYTGLDVPIPPLDHFMIVRYSTGSTPMDRCIDGHWSRTNCNTGDVSLMTMHEPSHWHWTQNIDVSHIYLATELMNRVASDITDRPVSEVRLHDLLQVQDPALLSILDALTAEAKHQSVGGTLYAEALGVQLAVHLLRHYANIEYPKDPGISGLSRHRLQRVLDYIEAHLHERISVQDLADIAGLGLWTFTRQFRTSTDCSPYAYIVQRRVCRAKLLLTTSHLEIKEIAGQCGFADQSHLTRAVQACAGMTPAQLRATARH